MTEYEERTLNVIFNEKRVDVGIRLWHAPTRWILKSDLAGLSSFVGKRKGDKGELLLRFDSADGRDDYCVRVSDVGFCNDKWEGIALTQAEDLISGEKI